MFVPVTPSIGHHAFRYVKLLNGTHFSDPGAQQADADFAIVIQVGIESPAALRQVAKQRWNSWVDVWQLDVKQEQTVLVWRACRPFDERREQVLFQGKQRNF